MKKLTKALMIFTLLFAGAAYAAATPNPVSMLNQTSQSMLSSLRANKARIKNNPNQIYLIVKKILLPHVDLNGMSRSVLGRSVWNSISPAQRKDFGVQFTKLIVRTYSSALSQYSDETVKFYPVRGGFQGRSRIQIQSKIIRSNGPVIPISYRLILLNGQWKVYDFSVEGISIIRNFQSQFAAQLSQGNFQQVLNNLKQHNRKNG